MRILLGISALVLVAILWAMISIFRHVRLTRHRNRFLREQEGERKLQSHLTSRDTAARMPLPARFAAPVGLPLLQAVASPVPTPAQRVAAPTPPAPTPPAPQTLRILEFVPDPAFIPDPTTVEVFPAAPAFPSLYAKPLQAPPRRIMAAASADANPTPHLRRPVRSAPPPPRPAAVSAASGRPDWDYFNKDMGDLSDPTPSRIRDRVRTR
jgi:hypothetical protein